MRCLVVGLAWLLLGVPAQAQVEESIATGCDLVAQDRPGEAIVVLQEALLASNLSAAQEIQARDCLARAHFRSGADDRARLNFELILRRDSCWEPSALLYRSAERDLFLSVRAGLDLPPCGDADADGVADEDDACPDTPAGAIVDASGCPKELDDDGDGIPNDQDRCPSTPVGAVVDAEGCPIQMPAGPDRDGDGVPDDRDECPGTEAGQEVDLTGCPKGGTNWLLWGGLGAAAVGAVLCFTVGPCAGDDDEAQPLPEFPNPPAKGWYR